MLDLNENASRFKLSCVADHQFAIFNLICWCGSMAEQLIRNEQVVSSILTTSSKAQFVVYQRFEPFSVCIRNLANAGFGSVRYGEKRCNKTQPADSEMSLGAVCLFFMITFSPPESKFHNTAFCFFRHDLSKDEELQSPNYFCACIPNRAAMNQKSTH